MEKLHGGMKGGQFPFDWRIHVQTGLLIRILPQIHSFWNYLEIRNSLQRTHHPIKLFHLFHTNAPSLQLGHNWSRLKSPDKQLVTVYWLYLRDDMHADTYPRPDHLLMHHPSFQAPKLWIHHLASFCASDMCISALLPFKHHQP